MRCPFPAIRARFAAALTWLPGLRQAAGDGELR
jgi:hypothetical protein